MKEVNLKESKSKKNISLVLYRVAWIIVYNITAKWLPDFFSPYRIFLLKIFGAKISFKTLICKGVRIDIPNNLEMGVYSAIGQNVWLYNFSKITIGSNTVISQGTVVCTASHNYGSSTMDLFSKPISINDYVWVAAECFILPGITIGKGAVVGSRSLVTKDIPEFEVHAGNPCKFVKKRVINE